MKISNLQLRKYFFPLILVAAQEPGKGFAIEIDKTFATIFWPCEYLIVEKITKVHPDRPSNYIVDLRIESGNSPGPYQFALQCIGEFEIDSSYPDEKAAVLAAVNGASVLYSACRELLIDQTSKSAHGSLTLPTIGFEDSLCEKVCPTGLSSVFERSGEK